MQRAVNRIGPAALAFTSLSVASARDPQGLLGLGRQFDENEIGRWIEVVLSGLVDHPQIPLPLRILIRDNHVDLALLQVLAVLVLDAQGKSVVHTWLYHGNHLDITDLPA